MMDDNTCHKELVMIGLLGWALKEGENNHE
jgi:hypothetical protein